MSDPPSRRGAMRWWESILMLASAHGESPAIPEGVLRVDVRDSGTMERLLAGIDVVCHQAAVVGAGVDANDSPAFASHNDFGTAVLLAAMHRARCRRLVLASSMVVYGDGQYRCERHGIVDPPPDWITTFAEATSTTGVPSVGSRCPGSWSTRMRRSGPGASMPPARWPRSTSPWLGRSAQVGRSPHCAITMSTAIECPGTRRTPGWRPCFALPSKRVMPPGLRGR